MVSAYTECGWFSIFNSVKLLILLALAVPGWAQSVSTLMGARGAALGYATAASFDEWSIFNNPAGLAAVRQSTAGFALEAFPALPGANRTGAAFTQPFAAGAGAVALFRFGDPLYSEQLLSVGYGHQMGNTALGVRLSYIQYRASGFETRHALGVTAGGITELLPSLWIGAYALNINMPTIGETREKIPTVLLAGLRYQPTDRATLATEIEKDVERDLIWKSGMEYRVHKKIFARSGFWINPSALFIGIGFAPHRLKIDYALHHSWLLGTRHMASAVYFINRKNTGA